MVCMLSEVPGRSAKHTSLAKHGLEIQGLTNLNIDANAVCTSSMVLPSGPIKRHCGAHYTYSMWSSELAGPSHLVAETELLTTI